MSSACLCLYTRVCALLKERNCKNTATGCEIALVGSGFHGSGGENTGICRGASLRVRSNWNGCVFSNLALLITRSSSTETTLRYHS